MKRLNYFLIFLIIMVWNGIVLPQSIEYYSPKNNSILVSLTTNIILKSTDYISTQSLSPQEFRVVGSESGSHPGVVKLSDDNKTILFNPDKPFDAGEEVSVSVLPGIKTTSGYGFSEFSFKFKTTPLTQKINLNPLDFVADGSLKKNFIPTGMYKTGSQVQASDSLPPDFPKITVGVSNNPSDGKIFLANDNSAFSGSDSIGNFIMILNNDGSVVKYRRTTEPALDFKVQPNGELSYADIISLANGIFAVRWIVLDTNLTPIDTVQCGNGYTADTHDFLILPNGHYLLFSSDPEPVDMSQVVPSGNPNATVIGAVIQELDASKNVVFQWRSWDYLPFTDSYFNLTSKTVDLIHGNALDVDKDGNIIFSMRHLSSIIKIDRSTGNIDWVLGGKENQFTFINENEANSPNYFSYQHDARILPNGDLTLFDNGNQHSPPYSRAVEYKLDTVNKTATMVWEYRNNPDIYNFAMGSVQRLANGNSFIGWGFASANGSPAITEVHPDNSIALELYLPKGQTSYRAYKFPWTSETPFATVTTYEVLQGNTYTFNSGKDTTGITITFSQLNSFLYANAIVSKYNYAPLAPKFNTNAPIIMPYYFTIKGAGISSYTGEVRVNLNQFPGINDPSKIIVYARQNSDSLFLPLPTSYDAAKNSITFTTSEFGDYTLGIPQTIVSYPPDEIFPKDSEIVDGLKPVNLVWGTQGVAHSFHLQVATDSLFNNLVIDNPGVTSTTYTINTVKNNSTYYWRLNSTNPAGTSDWSSANRFYTASPYIKIEDPNGGEEVYTDSTYIIRWQANINDTVKIELLRGNNIVSVIGDTIISKTHAYRWVVPASLEQDSLYKIEVASISNSNLKAVSDSTFTVATPVTGIKDFSNEVKSFQLYQNYPNPFNPSTAIEYSVPEESHVRIDVFNAIGQRITTLVNSEITSGSYEVKWNAENSSSGVYFYSIRAEGKSGRNFFMVKKMIVLK